LLFLVLVAAVLLAWWRDHRRMASQLQLANLQIQELKKWRGFSIESVTSAESAEDPPGSLKSKEALVALVRNARGDWYEFQDALSATRNKPLAEAAVPELVELLGSDEALIRTRAAAALAQIHKNPKIAVPALIPLLNDPEPNVQWHAANALADYKGEARSAIAELRKKVMDDDSPIAAHSAICIWQIDSDAIIGDRLAELTTNRLKQNKSIAIRNLRQHVPPDVARLVLTRAFEAESDQEIQTAIARALNQLSE
jgi:HEAT repeat protein